MGLLPDRQLTASEAGGGGPMRDSRSGTTPGLPGRTSPSVTSNPHIRPAR